MGCNEMGLEDTGRDGMGRDETRQDGPGYGCILMVLTYDLLEGGRTRMDNVIA